MKTKLKNYQGGFSLIGIWPWTGVYAGISLILSSYIGSAGAVILTTIIFGFLAYIVEKKYPELNGLIDQPVNPDAFAVDTELEVMQKYLTN